VVPSENVRQRDRDDRRVGKDDADRKGEQHGWSAHFSGETSVRRRSLGGAIGPGVDNATVVVGDGSAGLPEHAPYDAILVAAAFPQVPAPLVEQLAEGGRLVQPIGLGEADEVVLFEKRLGELERRRRVTHAHFVRLYGEHAFP
jgi:hypothetical protein